MVICFVVSCKEGWKEGFVVFLDIVVGLVLFYDLGEFLKVVR